MRANDRWYWAVVAVTSLGRALIEQSEIDTVVAAAIKECQS